MQHRNRKHLSITIDPSVYKVVKELADKKNRSVSLQVEKLIEQALLLGIKY